MLGAAQAVMLGAAGAAPPTGSEFITTPEAHGWSDGNTVAQNTAAFNTAVSDASTNAHLSFHGRGVVELEPNKTYEVTGTSGGNRQPTGCIRLDAATKSNVWIRTHGMPTATARAVILLDPNVDAGGPRSIGSLNVIQITRPAQNVWVTHLVVDGNKMSIDLGNVEFVNYGNNGAMSAIGLNGAEACHLEWVVGRNAITDGLCIDSYRPLIDFIATTRFTAVDCDFHHNRRQGMSIIMCGTQSHHWNQIVFTRCKFRETGTRDGVFGQIPGYGVDIEPNGAPEEIWGLTFDACEISDNGPAHMHHWSSIGTKYVRGLGYHTGAWQQMGSQGGYFCVKNCTFSGNATWDDGDLVIIMNQNNTRIPGKSAIYNVIFENNTVEKDVYIEGFLYDTQHRDSTAQNVIIRNNTVKRITFRTFKVTDNSIALSGNQTAAGAATPVVTNGIATITLG